MSAPSHRERCLGSLLGLAIGDALGYPHEFRRCEQVRREIAPAGLTDFVRLQDPRFSRPFFTGPDHPPGTFTDDTQMSIALAEGLLDVDPVADLDTLMQAIARRFIQWSRSEDNNRAPGSACMTGCANLGRGVPWREAGVADSKGCGSAMRVAPLGLVSNDLDWVADTARASSLLTHGHPAALEGAAACALMVALARQDLDPTAIHDEVARRCGGRSPDFDAVWRRVPLAIGREPDETLVEFSRGPLCLGESWVAEEAAASALYCFWRHPDNYRAAVLEGINTDGDSDSIGAIAGSVLGARVGLAGLPEPWVQGVENSTGLQDLARRLASRLTSGAS
ncbi:MAG: ADP-ribosylglycohydrolase family protein [Pseudomonadota bacterium]